ncbi:hypothetical protein DIPPA_22972 [Diplonema papillatum]|nr:hypothetical protein DIPPA_22972 [Diplonema papillatum]|eukprot:gene11503-17708_t
MARFVALAFMCHSVIGASVCVKPAECDRQVDTVVAAGRKMMASRVGRQIEQKMSVAPASVAATKVLAERGLLSVDTADAAAEAALLRHFSGQLAASAKATWLYYGDDATGKFVGARRILACELSWNCQYTGGETKATTRPTMTAASVVTLTFSTATNTLSARIAQPDGSPGELIYSDSTYRTTARPWYDWGLRLVNSAPPPPTAWTSAYLFNGGSIGVSYVQAVVLSGRLAGVLGGDLDLADVAAFAVAVDLPADDAFFIASAEKKLLANNRGISNVALSGADLSDATNAAAVGSVIASAASTVFSNHPELGRRTEASWPADVMAGAIRSGVMYHAVPLPEARWTCVVSSAVSVAAFRVPSRDVNCTLLESCRARLQQLAQTALADTVVKAAAQADAFFKDPPLSVASLDNAYANGLLTGAQCTASCTGVAWNTAAEVARFKLALRGVFDQFPGLSSVFVASEETGGQLLGYSRAAGGEVRLWRTCEAGDPCTANTAGYWDEATDAFIDADAGFQVSTQSWYRAAKVGAYPFEKYGWSAAPLAVDGRFVMNVVQPVGHSTWADSSAALWGANVALAGVSEMLRSVSVAAGTVLYIMQLDMTLLAVNSGSALDAQGSLQPASTHPLPSVQKSAVVVHAGRFSITADAAKSYLVVDGKGSIIISAVSLRDGNSAAQVSYNWLLVAAADEEVFFDLQEAETSSVSPVVLIVVLVLVFVAICVCCIVAAVKRFANDVLEKLGLAKNKVLPAAVGGASRDAEDQQQQGQHRDANGNSEQQQYGTGAAPQDQQYNQQQQQQQQQEGGGGGFADQLGALAANLPSSVTDRLPDAIADRLPDNNDSKPDGQVGPRDANGEYYNNNNNNSNNNMNDNSGGGGGGLATQLQAFAEHLPPGLAAHIPGANPEGAANHPPQAPDAESPVQPQQDAEA